MLITGGREDFVVGTDELKDIQINPPKENSSFCWFYHARRKHLIKYFVLSEQPQVIVRCDVRLIVKDGKLIPRFNFSKRRRESPKDVVEEQLERTEENLLVKASVDLDTASQRMLDAAKILELANKAYFLYVKKDHTERAKLLKMVLSNCGIDALSLYPTYRKPFDLIFQKVKTEEWCARSDSNTRPCASEAHALSS